MKPDTVVFDLDGTLANIDHRKHLVQTKYPEWEKFYEACDKDGYNDWLFTLLYVMLEDGYKVVIVSARHKNLWDKTVKWLEKKAIVLEKDEVEMHLVRENFKDQRPDTEIKKLWLDSYGRDRILFVVDDRQKVVDMWRREGVKVLQCDKWEEYKRPKKSKVSA